MVSQIKNDLKKLSNKEKAVVLMGFFKTAPGEYGEGDKFIGVTVPNTRIIAKKYQDISIDKTVELLKSEVHEHRLCALLILVVKYENGNQQEKKRIYHTYLKNSKYINNWDLVDLSAHKIVGEYILLEPKERKTLLKLASSQDLWERRISIVATFAFIKKQQFDETLKISKILLEDSHDLIHKAVGWMLRELGKKDQSIEENFLEEHHKIMPRTMLRYSIEKFSDKKRKYYMKK